MCINNKWIRTLLVVGLTMTSAASHAALTSVLVGGNGNGQQSFVNPTGTVTDQYFHDVTVVYNGQPVVERWGSTLASASADYGVLKAYSNATEVRGLSGLNTNAGASFLDRLTIDSAGLAGQIGYLDVTVFYAWDLLSSSAKYDPAGNGFSYEHYATVSLTLGGATAWARQSDQFDGQDFTTTQLALGTADGAIGRGGVLGESFSVLMPFMFGSTIDLALQLFTTVGASNAFATVDAANSAYWGGFSVLDANGNRVDFSAASESGTDYTRDMRPSAQAVPEPGAMSLALMGLAILGAARRQRGAASAI